MSNVINLDALNQDDFINHIITLIGEKVQIFNTGTILNKASNANF